MITVAGGVYRERCLRPQWNQLFGSAGRAAAALADRVDVRLVTLIDKKTARDLEALVASLAARGHEVKLEASTCRQTISFDYVHPLSVPSIFPPPDSVKSPPLKVKADVVLRYGMLESTVVVDGQTVVYDPQSAFAPEHFRANGSSAKRLAIVANGYELKLLTRGKDAVAAAKRLREMEKAEVVVAKLGSRGAWVVTKNRTERVPAYRTELVFSIGSGDVFAAAFAYFWGHENLKPADAADLASRATALYCASRSPSVPSRKELNARKVLPVVASGGRVYLAGPFFTIAQRWLVEEARTHLLGMGLKVFSPLHDVGIGPAERVGPADLKGIRRSDRVLALVDGGDTGTLFEVGYARSLKLPVVALAEVMSDEQLKMLVGSGCAAVDDFATAIYRTAWS